MLTCIGFAASVLVFQAPRRVRASGRARTPAAAPTLRPSSALIALSACLLALCPSVASWSPCDREQCLSLVSACAAVSCARLSLNPVALSSSYFVRDLMLGSRCSVVQVLDPVLPQRQAGRHHGGHHALADGAPLFLPLPCPVCSALRHAGRLPPWSPRFVPALLRFLRGSPRSLATWPTLAIPFLARAHRTRAARTRSCRRSRSSCTTTKASG